MSQLDILPVVLTTTIKYIFIIKHWQHYFYLARDNRRPRFWIVGLLGCGSGCSSCCGSGGCGGGGCSCCCSSSSSSLGQFIN